MSNAPDAVSRCSPRDPCRADTPVRCRVPHTFAFFANVWACAPPHSSAWRVGPSKLRLGGLVEVAISRSTPKIPHLFFITNAQ
jgi:hypothetical protein